jgi:thiol:disulfide interchange protein DsbG
MNILARALVLALPLALAACDQTASSTAVSNSVKASAPAEIPASQEPSLAAARQFASGFETGNAQSSRQVFVFFDPQCPHCGMFWDETKKLEAEAHFVWVPVSVLNKTSLSQGAAILASPSPVAAMTEHEKKLLAGTGGMTAGEADPKYKAVIERNTRLLASFGAVGVPYVLSVNTQTGKLFAESRGMPAEKLASQLGWTPVAGRQAP